MSWGRVENPKKVFQVGETIKVLVKDIHDTKIALSLKFPETNPWANAAEDYAVGTVIEGKVARMTDFGAFVELPEGKTGMVHISEVSADYVEDISQYLKQDQIVKVKVINITEEGKISLSIKKAMPPKPRQEQGERGAGQSQRGFGQKNGSRNFNNKRYENKRPFNPQQVSSYEWNPRRNENASFEDMLNKFKQTSDDKMSDLKKYRGEIKRGSANRRSRQD